MGQRGRRVALGVLAWVGGAALTGAVAWNAVAVISDDGDRTGVLAPAQVTAALAEARASSTASAGSSPSASPDAGPTSTATPTAPDPSGEPTGTPGSSGTPAPGSSATPSGQTGGSANPSTPASPQASPAQATWVVTGGSVTAQCTDATIRLVAATPDDGWTVEVGSPGPEHVEVELHRSGSETRVRAACSGGVPVQLADESRSDHDSDRD